MPLDDPCANRVETDAARLSALAASSYGPAMTSTVRPAPISDTLHDAPVQAPRPVGPGDHVFLVDGSSFVFRAYFQSIRQDPKYNYRSDRLPTGAVRLFCTKLFQFIREGAAGAMPTHLAIIFDKSENSFRKELYPPTSRTAPSRPTTSIPQFPLMRDSVRAFGLTPVEQDRLRGRRPHRHLRRAGAGARRRRADHLRRQGPDAADPPRRRHVRPGLGRARRRRLARGAQDRRPRRCSPISASAPSWWSTCRRWPAIPPTTCPAPRASASRPPRSSSPNTATSTRCWPCAREIKQPKKRETLTDPESVKLIQLSRDLVTAETRRGAAGAARRSRASPSRTVGRWWPISRRWSSRR